MIAQLEKVAFLKLEHVLVVTDARLDQRPPDCRRGESRCLKQNRAPGYHDTEAVGRERDRFVHLGEAAVPERLALRKVAQLKRLSCLDEQARAVPDERFRVLGLA